MRGKWILFAGVTILLAVAAGALSVYRTSRKAPPPPPANPVQPAVVASQLSMTGLVQAQEVIQIPAPIDGTIESFGASVGEDVFEGQLLARLTNSKLDTTVERATLELEKMQQRVTSLEAAIVSSRLEASRARADASRVRSEFERLEKIYKRQELLIREGATPRLVFEKAQREYHEAKQDLELKDKLAQQADERVDALNRELDAAKKHLDEETKSLDEAKQDAAAGEVQSPADGIVIARRGAPGEEANRSWEDLFQIAVATSALDVVIQPEPPVLARIKVGQPAMINVAEVPGEPIQGTVREIKDGRVVVDFTSPTPAIRPGVTAQVTIKFN